MRVKHKPLVEAVKHFLKGYEKKPKNSGDLQLYGGTTLAKELWIEWLPIYIGITDILAKIQKKLAGSQDGAETAHNADSFLKEIKQLHTGMLAALEDSDQNGQEKTLAMKVKDANSLLEKIHKFIKDSEGLFTKDEKAKQEAEAKQAQQESDDLKDKLTGMEDSKKGDSLLFKVMQVLENYDLDGKTYSILTGDDVKRAQTLAVHLRDCFEILAEKGSIVEFIKFLDKRVPLEKLPLKSYNNLDVIAESLKKGRLYTGTDNVLFDPSQIHVFNQHRADFNYTLELFNLAYGRDNDGSALGKLLSSLTPKMYESFLKSLFNGNDMKNKIKKAGFFEKDRSEKTLFGTVTIFSNVNNGVGTRKANDQGSTGQVKVGSATLPGFNHLPKTLTAARNAERVSVNGVFVYDKAKRGWVDPKGTLWKPEQR